MMIKNINIIKNKLNYYRSILKHKFNNYSYKVKSDISEKNRFLMIALFSLFIFDYLLFCYISARNPLNIFPAIPLMEQKRQVKVYLPDIDAKTILKEIREISVPETEDGYASILIDIVIKGSNIDNTSISVPINLFKRKIWLTDDLCIVDFDPSLVKDTADRKKIIANSQSLFRETLEKTLTENIPTIKKIILLERGIPNRSLWPQSI